MLLAVVAIKNVGSYRLRLTFNDKTVKEIDFSTHWDKLAGPIFQPLRDPMFFARVTLPADSETIEWPNGADLAAEFLYQIGEPVAETPEVAIAA
jgi:hypothetical protein